MARSRIAVPTKDPISDNGAVLWSIVQGEQLEYPVDIEFIDDAEDYLYSSYMIEAENVEDQEEKPEKYLSSGVVTALDVRVPTNMGAWAAGSAYNATEIVLYEDKWYVRLNGTGVIDATPPSDSEDWEKTVPNRVWIKLPKELSLDWTIQPDANYNTYGFFELLVREPSGLFPKRWKPVRGMVEFCFSPIEIAEP
jgi:hypothetical protein